MVAKPRKVASTLYHRIRDILESARANIVRTVNTTQVVANWLIGREIVEEEQKGLRRAAYGSAALADLSKHLGQEFGRGYSVDNLEAFRQFYLDYPKLISETASRNSTQARRHAAISATLSRKLIADASAPTSPSSWQPGMLHPALSWSHYRCLLRVTREGVRWFYEIEATRNP